MLLSSSASPPAFTEALQHAQKTLEYSFGNGSRSFGTMASRSRFLTTLALSHLAARSAIPGDFIETGTYVGGSTVAMMRVLDELGSQRRHWACDSFAGLPRAHAQDLNCVRRFASDWRRSASCRSCSASRRSASR